MTTFQRFNFSTFSGGRPLGPGSKNPGPNNSNSNSHSNSSSTFDNNHIIKIQAVQLINFCVLVGDPWAAGPRTLALILLLLLLLLLLIVVVITINNCSTLTFQISL